MISNLPFTALRTFEAVARQRGFGRAAEELGVTQSAVSQQIRLLEDWLGMRLLNRHGGRVSVTDEGARLAAAVAQGFGGVADICRELRDARTEPMAIGLSCLPGFAYVWLIPRLIGFDQRHPEHPVSIATSARLTDFSGDDADIAIRYGMGRYPGLHVEKLLEEWLFPVCAPSLLENGPPLRTVADLSGHTLLVDDVTDIDGLAPTWQFWANESGVTLPKPARLRRFGQSNMVVQAAVRGLGVALGRSPLVMDAITAGDLVKPFGTAVASRFAYWLVCPPDALKSPRIAAFRDWVLSEAADHTRSVADHG
jgi:LysR family transcriptional regulator, glycine cleavage system transcriptional activator